MPSYIITAPDGRKFKVTGQGSKEDALAHIQRQATQPEQQEDFDFSAGEMISNIPRSAVQFAKNVAMPFLHPIDTAKGIGRLGGSLLEKGTEALSEASPESMSPEEQSPVTYMSDYGYGDKPGRYDTQASDMAGQMIKDRYGSVENFQKTAQEDPVGLLADLSMILTAGGSAAATLPGKAGKIGQFVKKAGMAAEPINLTKGALKLAVSKATSKAMPAAMYESSAKFSTTIPKSKRTQMAETALKYKIRPTSTGIKKLDTLVTEFDTKIDGLIDDATKAGKTIPRAAVYRHLKGLRQEASGMNIDAAAEVNQINRVAKTLDLHLRKLGKDKLTPNELQSLKQSTYEKINFDASQLRSRVGTKGAQKAIARAAKESIESVADVKDLNRELGKLLELRGPRKTGAKALEKSASRIENRNIVGIDEPIKIATGTAAGGAPGAAIGTGLAILEHPQVKAILAIKLKEIQDAGALNLIDQRLIPTLTHYGLLESGRIAQLPPGDEE